MANLVIESWKPLRLILDDIGPFRQGPATFNFQGRDPDGALQPANLYMLLAENGHGKTTALEAIYGLFGLMAEPPVGRFVASRAGERAQIDVRAEWRVGSTHRSTVLSIWTGGPQPLESWTEAQIQLAEAENWECLSINAFSVPPAPTDGTTDGGLLLWREVREAIGENPSQLYGASQSLPTVLYFPADRRILAPEDERAVKKPSQWGYQPAQRFDSDGPEWENSIDNLLVWLEWVEDDRIEDLIHFLNEQLFVDTPGKALRRPRRQTLAAYISTTTGEHPLQALSHGERALLQLHARTLCHMTASTILLVDELENHLHPRWAQRLYLSLKSLLKQAPMLSTIFTTHNMEIMETLRDDVPEVDVIKGGYLIEEKMR